MIGRVVRSTGSFATVRSQEGGLLECRLKGLLRTKGLRTTNPVAVGDWVHLQQTNGGEYLISAIQERENYIIRKSVNLSAEAQIIAANLDQAALVVTLHSPRTSTGFIDRFLITCEAYHIPAFLVVNKIDLYDHSADQELLHELKEIYGRVGYPVIEVSAEKGQNLDQLRAQLHGKVTLFSGHSGSGKSSLINMLKPELKLRTGEISSTHHKGKHTTTFAEMLDLEKDTWLIDTPGVKEFGLVDMEPAELRHYFPEFTEFSDECRFGDCMHQQEPGCAVRMAAEHEKISIVRYHSYIGIMESEELQKKTG
jgi:ribosome biogenesis GTPase / thiamine phosphate phosphatase